MRELNDIHIIKVIVIRCRYREIAVKAMATFSKAPAVDAPAPEVVTPAVVLYVAAVMPDTAGKVGTLTTGDPDISSTKRKAVFAALCHTLKVVLSLSWRK